MGRNIDERCDMAESDDEAACLMLIPLSLRSRILDSVLFSRRTTCFRTVQRNMHRVGFYNIKMKRRGRCYHTKQRERRLVAWKVVKGTEKYRGVLAVMNGS